MVEVSIVLFKVLLSNKFFYISPFVGHSFWYVLTGLVCVRAYVCVCVTSVLCYNLYPVIIKFLVETDNGH
jgi:hypothetical protein